MADVSANFSTDSSSASAYNNGPNITGTPSIGKSETDKSFNALSMMRQNVIKYFVSYICIIQLLYE